VEISLNVIRKPLIKFLVFILMTFFIYLITKLTALVSGVFNRYCTLNYEVSQPVYSHLTAIYFQQYYLKNIFPAFKNAGIKYTILPPLREGDYKDRKREFFNFSFERKILSDEEIYRIDTLIKNGIKESYAFALKTELYYQYIQKLYANHRTNRTMTLQEVFLEMTGDGSNINKNFPDGTPFILISGPDVRVIPELFPIFREMILWIFSIFISASLIIVWISMEKKRSI